jgi:hypothetical protein
MPDQVFMIPFDEREPEIGMGFNTRSGEFVGTALSFRETQSSAVNPGQHSGGTAQILNSHEELSDSLDASMSLSARYGLASGSVKMKFSSSTHYNSTSSFVLAQIAVSNTMTRGHSPSIIEPGSAKELLSANRLDEFHRAYGDSFVRGVKTGGEYFAVSRVTSVDQSVQTSLAATLSAEVNGLVAGGSFQASYNSAQKSESSQSEVFISYYQASGSGISAGATVDVDSVIERFKGFSTIVKDSPVGVMVEIAAYDTVPIPVPTLDEIENLEIALGDAHAKRLQYLTIKNNFEFALSNRVFFDDPPPEQDMRQVADAYTDALNKVMAHAVALAKGQINPATLFDTSALRFPSVPELKRHNANTNLVEVPGWNTLDDAQNGAWVWYAQGGKTYLKSAAELGLSLNIVYVPDTGSREPGAYTGVVISSDPPGSVPPGSTVTLTVSE